MNGQKTTHEVMSREARRLLISNATESVAYIAHGSVMKRELAERFDLPEQEVEMILRAIAADLGQAINRL